MTQCGSDLHYGNFVRAGGLVYAHLHDVTAGIDVGITVLQGDALGTQGATGNVKPCANPTDQSGSHLHWQFDGIGYGTPVPTIDAGSWGISTNSTIGEYSTEGLSLRTYYINHGGWNSIGWTAKHCPGACTLDMTANNSWGRMQDFQHDPDGFGGQFDTIHVAHWDTAHAYLVDSVFWPAWAAGATDVGGINRPISMARQERQPSCPPGSTSACVSYQKFHLGYVWMDVYTGRTAVYCPDPSNNYKVEYGDFVVMTDAWNAHGPPNPSANGNPLADFDGDNQVKSSDFALLTDYWNRFCYPH